MSAWLRRHVGLLSAGVVAALAAVGLLVQPGLTSGKAPLWTEKPMVVAPATEVTPNWVGLAKALRPAVVHIAVKKAEPTMPPGVERFFGPFTEGRPRREASGLGSGFVIDPAGHIVTNNHVVDGAIELRVKLADGRELPATVVGKDAKTDLALLKIEATDLPVVPLGDSATPQVGEQVMAIGNPFGLEQTVTTGIVSATGRVIGEGPYDDFIQTDASINPGNSGGPLINARGQAIGVNTAIFSQTGGSVGIGFAIPSNLAKSVVTQLAEHGAVQRGWLGVTIQPLTPALAKAIGQADLHGALVSAVTEGSPAAKAGLRPGDVITQYDGRPVARSEELPRAVAETPIGRAVPLAVVREGKPLTLEARITRLQDEPAQTAAEEVSRHRLGVAVEPVSPARAKELGLAEGRGLLVRGVTNESPAAQAGLRPGDVLLEANRETLGSVGDLRRVLEREPAGSAVLLRIQRAKATLFVAVTV
jgi:serine protease Do